MKPAIENVHHYCIFCDADTPAKGTYEPCANCQEQMDRGITLIGVVADDSEHIEPITIANGQKMYPTGAWLVVDEETINSVFSPMELVATVFAKRKAFVDMSVIEYLEGL